MKTKYKFGCGEEMSLKKGALICGVTKDRRGNKVFCFKCSEVNDD